MATTPVAPLPAGAPAPTPVPVSPALTNAPITPVPAVNPNAPLGAGSTREDVIAARIASKFPLAAPVPPSLPVASPSLPPTPVSATAAPTLDPVDSTLAPAPVLPPTIDPTSDLTVPDLDALDFDKPLETAPPPAVPPTTLTPPSPALTPALSAAELARIDEEFRAALTAGDLDKVEAAFLRTPRGKLQLQSFKTMRELAAPPEPDGKGGIGHIPTIDEIKAADVSHREMAAIRFDVENDLGNFVRNLVTVRSDGRSFVGGPQQIQQVLGTIPEILWNQAERGDPLAGQFFDAYAAPVLSRTFNHQFSVAAAMPEVTPEQQADKARAFDSLRVTEYLVTGRARDIPTTSAPQPNNRQPATRPDPETERLRLENDTLRRQQAHSKTSASRAALATLDSTTRINALDLINHTFEASGVTKHFHPSILDPVKEKLYTSISAQLAGMNPTGWQTYEFQKRQVEMGQLAPAVAAQTFKQLFTGGVRTSADLRSTLTHYVTAAKASAAHRQAAVVDPQMQVAPAAPGTPVPTSLTPANQRERQAPNGGGDRVDQMQARLATALNNALASKRQG